jgi:hypothetical protein
VFSLPACTPAPNPTGFCPGLGSAFDPATHRYFFVSNDNQNNYLFTVDTQQGTKLSQVIIPQAASIQFDPVTGERTQAPDATTDTEGKWRCEPAKHGHDWVLLLEAKP